MKTTTPIEKKFKSYASKALVKKVEGGKLTPEELTVATAILKGRKVKFTLPTSTKVGKLTLSKSDKVKFPAAKNSPHKGKNLKGEVISSWLGETGIEWARIKTSTGRVYKRADKCVKV